MSELTQQLASGHLGIATIAVWTVLSILVSIGAGAAAGVKLAGKDLGNSLAAMMGAMYGPVAAVPAILLGLILLAFI